MTCIADCRVDRGVTQRLELVDVELHQVTVVHRVSLVGEPESVVAGAPADVRDHRRSRWQPPLQDLLGALGLQRALGGVEPVSLLALLVVGPHPRISPSHETEPAARRSRLHPARGSMWAHGEKLPRSSLRLARRLLRVLIWPVVSQESRSSPLRQVPLPCPPPTMS